MLGQRPTAAPALVFAEPGPFEINNQLWETLTLRATPSLTFDSARSNFTQVRTLRLQATAAAESEKSAPINQNWLRALVVVTAMALLPLHRANMPDNYTPAITSVRHFAVDPTRVALKFAVDPTQAALKKVFTTIKTELTPPKPSTFKAERAMGFSQLMSRWDGFVEEASQRFNVPAAWIRAVMRQESGGRTMTGDNKPIKSHAGAVGLMQLMPATYREMRKAHDLGTDAQDPHDNIMAGAAYLHLLHGRYGFPAMFAAYNAGPGALEHHLRGASLPAETVNYIASITAHLADKGADASSGNDNAKALIQFTRPNGKPVLIDSSKVASVGAALPREYPRGTHAVIRIGRQRQAVRETVTMVKSALRARGGLA